MSREIQGGIEVSGSTSEENSSVIFPSRTSTAAISVMRAPRSGEAPVVSTSTTT